MQIGNNSVSFRGLMPTHACERLESHLFDVGFRNEGIMLLQKELNKISTDAVIIDSFAHDESLGSNVITGVINGTKTKRPFFCEVFDSTGMIKDIAESIFHAR